MEMKKKCPHCGKMVDLLCSYCWRCKDCPVDCEHHMERIIDGTIGKKE